ncbi:MAG: NADH-quinone oxidoreductase subunit E [Desertifilum sp. SIO1I2]|nr:NADH-quinone oxidoreductase subunit E [Desertifilum sp. SIO1I2]
MRGRSGGGTVGRVSTTSLDSRVREIVARHAGWRGPLLPILHAVQEEMGYVDPAVVPTIAHELNLSVAEVHGVVSFYRDFRSAPPAPTQVRICRAEACQAVGGEALAHHAATLRAPGAVDVDDVFCLGNCSLGPSVIVNGRLHGRMTAARLDALVAEQPEAQA